MDPNSIIDNVSNLGLEWYYTFNPPAPGQPVSTQYLQPGVQATPANVGTVTTSINAGPDSGLFVIVAIVAILYLLSK